MIRGKILHPSFGLRFLVSGLFISGVVSFDEKLRGGSCDVHDKSGMAIFGTNAPDAFAVRIAKFVSNGSEAIYNSAAATENLFEDFLGMLVGG